MPHNGKNLRNDNCGIEFLIDALVSFGLIQVKSGLFVPSNIPFYVEKICTELCFRWLPDYHLLFARPVFLWMKVIFNSGKQKQYMKWPGKNGNPYATIAGSVASIKLKMKKQVKSSLSVSPVNFWTQKIADVSSMKIVNW